MSGGEKNVWRGEKNVWRGSGDRRVMIVGVMNVGAGMRREKRKASLSLVLRGHKRLN